ncbi:MAG: chorismate synthase [Ruminococcaceae bacterium]|nr:chorismate synthase [Oscillospiraceae bacterium]
MSNVYGNNIKLKIFGGSHDEIIGMTLDGFPAGVTISAERLQAFMNRRAPGNNAWSTKRKEPDVPEFISGVDVKSEDGQVVYSTNGDTVKAVIRNTNQHSSDYSSLASIPRPSHADFAARMKFGESVDLRGGGKYSGRLTAPLCIAGALCLAYLERHGITVGAHIYQIGGVKDKGYDPVSVDADTLIRTSLLEFPVIDADMEVEMKKRIEDARKALDSIGGIVECAVVGLPVGIGDHPFDGLEGRISSIVFSIPAVKAIEFGDGFAVAERCGSQNNDAYVTDGKRVLTSTNRAGGIIGGMSSGMPLIFRAAIKPTPSISVPQNSVDLNSMQNVKLVIKGRHDPCIVPRAVPIFEAAAALAILDALLD